MDFEIRKFPLYFHWGPENASGTVVCALKIYLVTNLYGNTALISWIAQEVHKAAWHSDCSVSYWWNDFTAVEVLHVNTVLSCNFRLKCVAKANFTNHSLFGNSNWVIFSFWIKI